MSLTTISPGLENVVAASARLSSVDGLAGELIIAGYALEELAENATAEETIFLLWQDRLPSADEFDRLSPPLGVAA
ncbi:MAG: citrate/2-methylcitrate synthase [Caldilineaceae bacterium]